MRLAVGIEYNGRAFSGWQSQRSGTPTIQDCLESALARVADQPVRVITAGRTDAGVHASGQVAHFDCDRVRTDYSWYRGANTHLPGDIRVRWVRPVSENFHARFSAIQRSYRYILYNATCHSALFRELSSWVFGEIDLESMQNASRCLIGKHDFSAFRAAGCQAKTPVRTVREITFGRRGPWLWMDITADAFLQHMVRNIVGTLLKVGRGDARADWVGRVLTLRDRTRAGATMPPGGLYLTEVTYGDEFGIPPPSPVPSFW